MTPPGRFADLQRRFLRRLQGRSSPEDDARAVVVCPSLTFPAPELRKITGIEFYEERMLCTLLLLLDPQLEVLYPTSMPVDEAIIDYYLSWLPNPEAARTRLHLFPVGDRRAQPLTDKLLARPAFTAEIRDRLRDPSRSFILPFNVTASEMQLAEVLGLGLYGPDPDLIPLGSKSGGRRVALEAGVAVFDGYGDLYSLDQLTEAISRIRARRPAADAAVVKLNNGFSGQGNVIVPLDGGGALLERSVFCAAEETWESYASKVEREGAIVEELVRGPDIRSPSVQVRLLPGTGGEVLSTHDQILGGPDDQVYLGCRFPADPAYRVRIQEDALRVARVLDSYGVIGSFGIDFVVIPHHGVFLSEINLRLGGTTHPYLMAKSVTRGEYDPATGELLVEGRPCVYKASDNVRAKRPAGLTPREVIAAVADAGLAYDPRTRSGATLHLLGALPDHGKYGVECIAGSHDVADDLYEHVLATVDAL